MPRARSQQYDDWQTAAADNNASGCLSFYALPPLAVILIACLLAALASNLPIQTSASPIVQPVSIASTTSNGLSPIFTREVQYWGTNIIRWANASSLDPNLVATVMQIESCGDPRALSRSGAMGLFQVMPFHFHYGENGFDIETNARRGLEYLSNSLQTANGNPRLALAGYNGGIGVIGIDEWAWHAETQRYVRYGEPIYNDARGGFSSSISLDEWYQNYGAGLCRQAAQRLGLDN
ncbi:MAG TPA: transglycosylase SLT domain-containing protein [Anaerolineales bacterium]|jgi:soluble lytic murein transglycosylase-like protein|nr:transglycosylase SLT domain-containing protein [Anaerolineales bacterium]HQX16244.1 transglycosylase SLT domain-containing protein [Anaerolineales bacterium]